MTSGGEYQIHLILGDSMYSRIRKEKVFKGNPGERLVGLSMVEMSIQVMVCACI